jgi:Methylamine utilisation protein MauE
MSMIGIGIRWFFVLLLAASAISKLADMPGFYAVIKSYALLPEAVIPISAWTLAILELALAIWLAMGKRINVAALIVIALHFVYLIWLMIALTRGLHIPNCGCFGIYWARPLTWLTLLEDFILLVLAIVMWRSVSVSRRRTHA